MAGVFAASGEGIQLKYGVHKGRLIQQFAFESAHMKLRELRIWSGR